MAAKPPTLVLVWLGLLALLALTVAASFGHLGPLAAIVNFAIAAAKAGLILWFFMHLKEQGWLARLVAVAALAWLVILVGLTQADVATRSLFR